MIAPEYMFLTLLILISYLTYRGKQKYFTIYGNSYTKIMAGYLSWLLMLSFRVLTQEGILNNIFPESYAGLQSLTEALLLVAGGIFLGVGVMEWIPELASTNLRLNNLRNKMNMIYKLLETTGNNFDIEKQFVEIKSILQVATNSEEIECYQVSTENKLIPLNSESEITNCTNDDYKWYRAILQKGKMVVSATGTPHDAHPVVLMPLRIKPNREIILRMSWEHDFILAKDDKRLLKAAYSILKQNNSTKEQIANYEAEVIHELGTKLSSATRIQEQIKAIDEQLRKIINFDVLRLAVFDPRGMNITQYCYGKGKSLLTERNKSIPTEKTHLAQVYKNGKTVYISDLNDSNYEDDKLLQAAGAIKSITIPMKMENQVVAVLTLASETDTLPEQISEYLENELINVLLPLVTSDKLSQQLVDYNRNILDLGSALKQMIGGDKPSDVLTEISEMIVKKMPTTYCRIWRFNEKKNLLEAVCDASSRTDNNLSKQEQTIPINDLRWHKEVVQTGKLIVINQSKPELSMTAQEQQATLLEGLHSALLLPLMWGKRCIGVLSIAEMRNWSRRNFSLSDTIFARGLANIASQVLLNDRFNKRVNMMSNRLNLVEQGSMISEIFSDLPKRLATPLTSIKARTYQVKANLSDDDLENRELLDKIDFQTEKIINEIRNLQEIKNQQKVSVS